MGSIVRAIDLGFGHTKFTTVNASGDLRYASFPSLALASVEPHTARPLLAPRRTVSVRVGQLFYEVGPDVLTVGARSKPILSVEGYTQSADYKALMLGALHYMQADEIDVLVVGLPVSEFTARKSALERLCVGEHDVGKGRKVKVHKALVVAQPQGALVAYAEEHGLLDQIGQQENLIIDCGTRTLDWLTARGLRLVANRTIEDAFNKPYVRLLEVSNKKGISAKVELHLQTATGAKPQVLTVNDGDDLEQLAKRAVYADFRVGEINTAKGEEFMELRYPGGEVYLALGQAHGEVDALAVQREMIRRTIKEHLEKEKLLRPKGIKVLSLFFIESVARYRQYDKDGNPVKGDYARIFEEEYRRAAKLPAFQSLFGEVDLAQEATAVHDGYFSIDKKGRWADPELDKEGGLKNETSRADAERGYNLIMKEKEKLLTFSTPLKFIFSHSALKEGWDNPNVFQICALREMGSERERRQTLGRGLRLCVNQDGQRVYGHDVNRLTVIATESYQEFADQLQKEIEADTGIRFGIVEQHQFATIAITTADGKVAPLGVDQSKALWDHLRAAGHIDAKGKVQDSLKVALKDGKLALPDAFEPYRGQVAELLRKVTGRVEVKNRDDRETVPLRKGADGKAVTLSEDFKALWDRIKHKTTYRVQFDNDKLISDCTAALTRDLHIARARLQWRKAEIGIGKAGVEAHEKEGAYTVTLDEADIELPDLLTDLQDRTQLTRRTLVKILTECERLGDFKRNPQQFIEQAAEIINRCKRMALVDGIRYQRLGDDAIWAQELFETEELTGYLTNMLRDTKRSIYEHVVYDSATERDFADALEKDDDVVLYAKLPGWFKVPTPLGNYNPDWAVLVNKDGTRRLYFVVETKSSLFTDDLRNKESAKIECGKAHFKALAVGENPARYMVARSLSDVMSATDS